LFLDSSLLYLARPAEAVLYLEYAHAHLPTAESAMFLG
jgi:hypothetical protein